jgi:hypothetical protein
MSLEYRLENDLFVCYLDGVQRFACEEVALAFDVKFEMLLKHGDPGIVRDYYQRARDAFTKAGCTEEANSMVLVHGKFDIEELNQVVNCTGYVGKFWRQLQARVPT